MTTLSDITELIVDSEHKTAPKSETGYPLVRTSDIKRGRIDLGRIQRVDDATYKKWTRRAVPQPGDLILAREAPVGNVAVVTEGMHPVLGQRTVLLRPDLDFVDPTFLCALLLGDDVQYWMNAVANGSTVPHLNMSDIRSLKLGNLPELSDQRRIGRVIASFDDLIENNRRRIEILEEMARLLYREWFVHFRFPGHEDVGLVDSELGPIPEGWKVSELAAITEINQCSVRKSDDLGTIRYLDISSVGERTMDEPELVQFVDAPGRARRRVRHGDTIWSTVRPNRRSHMLMLDPPEDLICSTGFAVISPIGVSFSYLHELTSTSAFTAHLESRATGAAYPAVRPLDFDCFRFVLPPDAVTDRYSVMAEPMHQLQEVLRKQNAFLREARDLLLPRLVSGELDVSELELGGVLG